MGGNQNGSSTPPCIVHAIASGEVRKFPPSPFATNVPLPYATACRIGSPGGFAFVQSTPLVETATSGLVDAEVKRCAPTATNLPCAKITSGSQKSMLVFTGCHV